MQGFTSRFGQLLGLIGSGLLVLTSFGLPWLRFEAAGVDALGLEVPMSQVVGSLGVLGVVLGAIGWQSKRRTLWSTAVFFTALSSCMWLIAASVSPTTALEVPADETWSLSYGIDLCAVAAALMLVGSMVTLASTSPPRARNAPRYLRLGRGLAASVEMVNPRDPEDTFKTFGWFAFNATTATGIGAGIFAQALFGALIFGAGVK